MRNAAQQIARFTVALVGLASVGFALATPLGPVYPAPGGNTFSSSGSAGNTGGRTNNYGGFDGSAFSNLYWGPDSSNLPAAGLDGVLHAMTFTGISGTSSFWQTTSNYTNPTTSITSLETIVLQIAISGLGATPWVLASSLGLASAIGAVIDDSSALPFSANIAFTVGGNAINNLQQGCCNLTQSSFAGGFYYDDPAAVPEPGPLALLGVAMFGLAAVRRRSARNSEREAAAA